jgi:hypothetical protein
MHPIATFFLIAAVIILLLVLEAAGTKAYFRKTGRRYKEHHFQFSRYAIFILVPILTTIIFVYQEGWTFAKVAITFALASMFFEWFFGWAYHHIVGQRLWTYHRYAIQGYTSLLTLPIWAVAGGVFWFLAKAFL